MIEEETFEEVQGIHFGVAEKGFVLQIIHGDRDKPKTTYFDYVNAGFLIECQAYDFNVRVVIDRTD